jgi:oligopeptide transport system substrate-binding protein
MPMRPLQLFAPLSALLLAVAMIASLGGCSGGGGSDSGGQNAAGKYPPAPAGVLRFNQNASPKFLDPQLLYDIPSMNVVIHLFEPLVRYDAEGQIVAADAESWEHNEDYTLWTFKLRPNKWSNGDARTAHDYVYSIRRILTPSTGANYASMVFMFLEGGEEFYNSKGRNDANLGVRAIDDLTLEYRLINPAPFFPSLVQHSAWMAVHEGTITKYGPDWWREAQSFVSNGPFKFVEWRSKDRIIMEKNPHFWDAGAIHFNRIEIRFIENESTELSAFLVGDIDMTSQVPSREADKWRDRPEFFRSPMLGIYYIAMNHTRAPFNDVNVRRAFSLAIDRGLITERITRKGELPASGFIPHGMVMHTGEDYRVHAPAFIDSSDHKANVARAKELIAKAGYGPGGKSLPRIEYAYNEMELHRDIGEIVQRFWKDAFNADTSLAVMEWPTLLERMENLDYQLARGSWIGDYADPMTFLEIFQSDNGNNRTGYSNPKFDAAFKAACAERDADKRLELLIECERILVEEDCVMAPIYEVQVTLLKRPELKGVVVSNMSVTDLSRAYRE